MFDRHPRVASPTFRAGSLGVESVRRTHQFNKHLTAGVRSVRGSSGLGVHHRDDRANQVGHGLPPLGDQLRPTRWVDPQEDLGRVQRIAGRSGDAKVTGLAERQDGGAVQDGPGADRRFHGCDPCGRPGFPRGCSFGLHRCGRRRGFRQVDFAEHPGIGQVLQ
jgi:hypothetical protein